MARSAVTSNYYSILGVSPTADEAVIRAAYRALMRHYHPDTNPDPEAQQKAQEITAAFAVLRDPARRAEYDAGLSNLNGEEWWYFGEEPSPPPAKPPAMRGWALASAALALALVVAVWARPQPESSRIGTAPPVRQAPAAKPQPIVDLEPESERLARLRGDSVASPPPPQEVVTPIDEATPPLANPAPPPPAEVAASVARTPVVRTARRPTPAARSVAAPGPKPKTIASETSAGCRPDGSVVVSVQCKNERVATLDQMAAAFFSQSMARADASKKKLLVSAHTRSAETRGACRSDSCLTAAYLRQLREISAIMDDRSPPEK